MVAYHVLVCSTITYNVQHCEIQQRQVIGSSQRKLGSSLPKLRMIFTCINTLNEGWCETVVWDLTSHNNTRNEGRCETVVWDLTSRNNTLNEVVMAAWMLHGLCFGEEAGARNLVFPCKVAAAGDEWKVPRVCGGCGCGRFCRECVPPLCSATSGCSCVRSSMQSAVADRIGMAAWLLWSGVAMRVERCRFVTWCCKTHCNGCMNVAWILFWGGSRGTKPCISA